MDHTILLFLATVLLSNLSLSLQEQVLSNNSINQNVAVSIAPSNANQSQSILANDEEKRFRAYQDSVYFVPNYDPDIKSLPDVQLEFVRTMIANDLQLYRTILKEAIDKRNNFAPSVGLMFKYSGKLLGNFIRNRQTELHLGQRKDVKPDFYEMLAKTSESIIDRSNSIKREKGYTKKNVNVTELYRRADNGFNYTQRIINASPVGIYVQWNKAILYKNELSNPEHDKDAIEEAADLLAVSGHLILVLSS